MGSVNREPWRRLWIGIFIVVFMAASAMAGGQSTVKASSEVEMPAGQEITVGPPVRPAVFRGSLRNLPRLAPVAPGAPEREVPLGILGEYRAPEGRQPAQPRLDGALQPAMPEAVAPAEFLNPNPNFAGIGFTGFRPPDTVGDVGPNHYIQMVNASFQIWDKQGNSLAGPTAINQLWIAANAGGQCQANNNGDPIVLYDHLADRWVLTQFAVPNGFATPPTFECVAVSQTSDPVNGGWYLYEFQFNFGHDYPKLGVWPDAYYMTSQQGYPGGNLNLIALDRANMLNGNAATFQAATVNSPALVLLPSDLDGPQPPAGSPAFFARHVDGALWGGADRVEVFQLQVDWGNPANTTLSGPTSLAVAAFDSGLQSPGNLMDNSVPQPGTATLVATLAVWPMHRLQYRNFGTYEAMVFNHTVDADGNANAGIRWYELRRTPAGAGAWALYQQGTFAPQQPGAPAWVHRWMGSIAMDKQGNIALGYSVSDSNATFPSIRYAGRFASDPLGLLPQGEVTVANGTGSQTASTRWGDYSAMVVDPVDDCTFWYTQEFMLASGNWSTQIAAFRFPSCSATDLSITKTDSPDPVNAGGQLTYGITVQNNGPHLAPNVAVTDTLPAGVTYVTDTDSCVQGPTGTLVCNLGDLASGASRSFSILVDVDADLVANAGGPTTITNVAEVTSDRSDPDESNNTATAATFVNELADLRISKDCKPDEPLLAGGTGTCFIAVENLGPSTARDVTVEDVHVSNGVFTFGTITTSAGTCNVSGGTVNCDLGDLDPGDVASIEVPVSAGAPQDVNDQATVRSPTPDPNQGNNVAADGLSFTGAADLALTKTATPDPVVAGTQLTYDLEVTNSGPSVAVNVVIEDVLPAGVAIQSVSASGGTCNAGVPGNAGLPTTCTFDSLAVGASETMQVVVLVDPSVLGTLGNNAEVFSDTYDPDNSDNLATTATAVDAEADLSVTKADFPDPVLAGEVLTYDLTVANAGPSTAIDVTLSDLLPSEVLFMGYTVSNGSGTCALLPGPPDTLDCDLNDLLPGQSVTVVVDVLVDASVPHGTVIQDQAMVAAVTGDPDPSNNAATQDTTVQAEADLALAKDASFLTNNPAPRIEYTLTTTNLGPSDAQGVVLVDTLPLDPKKIVYVMDSGNGACVYSQATHQVTCSFGTVEAGEVVTVDIIVDARGSVRRITNVADVSSSTADPDAGNNHAEKELRVKGGPGPNG